MGIFSYLARKGKASVQKAADEDRFTSKMHSSEYDTTDDDHLDPSTSMEESKPMPRPSLKRFQYPENMAYSLTAKNLSIGDLKPRRVQFSSILEDVHYVENYCNDTQLDLWLTRDDYTKRYLADKAMVPDSKIIMVTSPSKKSNFSLPEWDYLKAHEAAYIQFCSNGKVEKLTQLSIVRGIDCGYRALERYSVSCRRRMEMCQCIRASTIQMYRQLEACGRVDSEKLYLLNQCENLKLHLTRWALFLGRLDRIAARRFTKSLKYSGIPIPPKYDRMPQQGRLLRTNSAPCEYNFRVASQLQVAARRVSLLHSPKESKKVITLN